MGQRGRRAAEGRHAGGVRRAAGRALAERTGGVGTGRRADPPPARRGRRRRLHARQHRRAAGVDRQVVRRAGGGRPRRRGALPRADRDHRDEPPRPPRHRGRPAPEPRAHPARDAPRRPRGASRPGPRPAGAHPADPEAAASRRSACSTSTRSSRRRSGSSWRPRLNNLLAAPGFDAWLEGEPLDIGALLHTPEGKPRVSIFSIAHLSDAERMFFVSLLLNETLGWVRSQSGTTSLRAIVYMDEIFGYFPPVANPPSKLPLLTLLKQARAFGVGVVLATQNPVDLDYKGLANTGTWFIGRLQTERDKARVLDGLEGAGGRERQALRPRGDGGDAGRARQPRLPHEQRPRGRAGGLRDPLGDVVPARPAHAEPDPAAHGGTQVDAGPEPPGVSAGRRGGATAPIDGSRRPPGPGPDRWVGLRPVLPPGVPQHFVPTRGSGSAGATLVYQPTVLGAVTVRFADAKAGVDETEEIVVATPDHRRRGAGKLGGGRAPRRRGRRSRDGTRGTRRVGSAPAGGRQGQELRDVEPRPRRVGLRAPPARASPRPDVGRDLPARREQSVTSACVSARRPGRSATSAWKPCGRSTRPSARRSRSGSGAPSRPRPGKRSRSRSRASKRRSRWEPRSSALCSGGRR